MLNNILNQFAQAPVHVLLSNRYELLSELFSDFVYPVSIFALILLTGFVIFQIIRMFLKWNELKRPVTLFEVVPPSISEQSAFTTSQLFTSVHGVLRQQSGMHRFFKISSSCSFELYSTKELGIRYVIRLPARDALIIKKNLIAYLPGVKVTTISEYLPKQVTGHVTSYRLSSHFSFPLHKQDNLVEYDPIAYITAAMTKLEAEELVVMQLIAKPISSKTAQCIEKIRMLFLSDQDVLSFVNQSQLFSGTLSSVAKLLIQLLLLPVGLIVWVFTGGREGPILAVGDHPTTLPDSSYRDFIELQIKQKIDQPLLSASLRLLTVTANPKRRSTIERGYIAALSSFSNGQYQALRPVRFLKLTIVQRVLNWLFINRFPGLLPESILSASELSDLFHFPYTSTTKTENVLKLHSKELPAPLSLKQRTACDVYFATNTYGGTNTAIGMSLEERRRHMYILGATGTGKSTMLLSMIEQDIKNNKGLCVIDPHGDLIEQILSVIPKDRISDVVYFNPDDIGYPMGINVLELTPGLSAENVIREKEFIAESIISLFHKIYGEKYSGPRMEYILRNTIHTVFSVPGATLFTINKILIDPIFRKSVVRTITDPNLRDFWKYEFSQAGDYQKVNMILPITNKIGRFLFSPTAKRILEQPHSTINFDTIMNDGKILLCNVSKGKIGEDNSEVLGILIMAKIQLAALKRSRMSPGQRHDFYLYVDEFQNFATESFAQILSEARKYKLNAILAHQTTSQIEDASLVNVTLANTGTVICFRTANPEDERMILPQFQPYVAQGEIASLPSFHFYMRLGALNPEESFSGVTTPVHIDYSHARVSEIIESSRRLFTTEWKDTPKVTTPAPKKIEAKPILNQVSAEKNLP